MNNLLDRNLFTQIGLDSGSVTMLGSVVHRLGEPVEYRGNVRSGDRLQATFYISVDPNCAVAELLIDLAKLTAPPSAQDDCCGGWGIRNSERSEAYKLPETLHFLQIDISPLF